MCLVSVLFYSFVISEKKFLQLTEIIKRLHIFLDTLYMGAEICYSFVKPENSGLSLNLH